MTQSPKNTSWVNAQLLRPCRCALRSSLECEKPIQTHVPHLFFLGSPTAIARLVVAVFVGIAIQAVFCGRRLSHIFKKVLKLAPPFTYGNTPAPVVTKLVVALVSAPVPHMRPTTVRARFSSAPRSTMFGDSLTLAASAAGRATALQVNRKGDSLFAADAGAMPCTQSPRFLPGVAKNGESAEAFAGEIDESRISGNTMKCNHDLPLVKVVARASRRVSALREARLF